MNIIYEIGDMFTGSETIYLHGCNAQGVMGSGVARQVRDMFPKVFEAYNEAYQRGGLRLGEIIACKDVQGEDEVVILNGITQNRYGRDGARYANYGAIEHVIMQTDNWMSQYHPMGFVAMPMIGAGLGGGDWGIISQIIERRSENFIPVVYDWTP